MTEQNQPKQENTSEESTDGNRIKLKKLNVNRETIQELADDEASQVKGGRIGESMGEAAGDPRPVGP